MSEPKWLGKEEIKEILYGATFLGGGGGGPLETAVEILEKLAKTRDVSIPLRTLDDPALDAKGYGAMVACLGSPEAMKSGTFGPDGVAAFNAFQKSVEKEGKTVKYLYSGEMGGFNTFAPMLVSIYSKGAPGGQIEFLDVDANGRAVPELNTSLNAARGFMPYPVGMGTLNKGESGGACNELIAYGATDSESERIARGVCGVFDNQIGFSTWAMCKTEFEAHCVPGCVTRAGNVGRALEKARENPQTDPIVFLQKATTCSLFGKGKIIKKETKIVSGFDCGTTTIQITKGRETGIFTVDFQNENLILRREDGSAIITAPEIITMICMDQAHYAHPLNNASTKQGMEIELIFAPADDKWWEEKFGAYRVWKDALARVGYTGEQIRYQPLDN